MSLWTSRMRRRSAAMLCSIFSSSVCGASGFSFTWARAMDGGGRPVRGSTPAAGVGSLLAGRGGSLSSAYLGAGGALGHEGGVSLADAAVLPAAQVLVAHLDAHLAGGTAQGTLSRGVSTRGASTWTRHRRHGAGGLHGHPRGSLTPNIPPWKDGGELI